MSMKAFKVEGDFAMGRMRQHFAVEMIGADENDAKEHTYKDLGSRHGVARRQISITSVTPLSGDAVSDITRKRLEKGA